LSWSTPLPMAFTTLKGLSRLSENLGDGHIILMLDTVEEGNTRVVGLVKGVGDLVRLE
jgi:hypothetical protein